MGVLRWAPLKAGSARPRGPAKVTLKQAAHFEKSLVRGEPIRKAAMLFLCLHPQFSIANLDRSGAGY
jgi:hypothetical protein